MNFQGQLKIKRWVLIFFKYNSPYVQIKGCQWYDWGYSKLNVPLKKTEILNWLPESLADSRAAPPPPTPQQPSLQVDEQMTTTQVIVKTLAFTRPSIYPGG